MGVKSLIDLPLTAQVIGFMPNNGGHWHFVTFRITHFCYLLDRINWIFGIICLYFQFPDEIENIKSLRERGRTLKIEHLLYADCWTIDAGFRELRLFPKRQGVSSWKSPIDILPVKKADQFNSVLCHLYSESIISKLDTIILLITSIFLTPLTSASDPASLIFSITFRRAFLILASFRMASTSLLNLLA